MLTKLITLDPEETSRRLDSIAEAFRITLSTKLKDNAVKQEVEKQDEAVKSCLRVSILLHAAIPAASGSTAAPNGHHQEWKTFWEWVERDFEAQIRALKDESRDKA
jgi:cullin-associated NEDD8-dissociated protein 1